MENLTIQNLEILTPNGWSKFDGIKRKKVESTIKLVFHDNTTLECTKDHSLLVGSMWKEAKDISLNEVIGNKVVKEKISIFGDKYVFDAINVGKGHAYYTNGVISHNCHFIGSSDTLLETEVLQKMWDNAKDPLTVHNSFRIYENPQPGYKYAITVDVSRGLGLDYHAFIVFDVTNLPYKLVAVFQDNTMYPTILPNVIAETARKYNNAHILVEISDIGQQVADMLIGDLDCDNVIRIMSRPGVGQVIGFGFAGKVQNGIKTSTATKKVGTADLKTLIESGNLIIEDKPTVKEFFTYVAGPNGTYAAEQGYHDDLLSCLTFFGWLSHQRYFREEAHDIREIIQRQQEEYLDSQLTPFGIFDDGVEQIHYDYGDNTFGNF